MLVRAGICAHLWLRSIRTDSIDTQNAAQAAISKIEVDGGLDFCGIPRDLRFVEILFVIQILRVHQSLGRR